ncbi:hypothetical protein PMZ80_001777 [Knufia obscura]|uniref:Integral membrane protein n=1 Tax=Knufia obscura TaxID=1635080 RepID=A0ABR0S440_9EURO|nr:hypothetical protein PMZ80_001777 [Knufia obscura]
MSRPGNMTDSSINFINPATQTPLFTAEWITCAYPVSDLYAPLPRYLYYALLVLVFLTQWHSWLANVFLGAVATYAGTAAIEAFILMVHKRHLPQPQEVSIPFIDSESVRGNETLSTISNLITNRTTINVQSAALDFDIDAVTAITITGYLAMLPMHCWSSAVRANRARHFLILLWNALMFAGMICSIVLWPSLFDSELQYRFCYPTMLDSDSVTSDGRYDNSFWHGNWNDTIWDMFADFSVAGDLNNNCFYPCFNTSQILRRENSLIATLTTHKSPRTSLELWAAGLEPSTNIYKESTLWNLMYMSLMITTVIMLFLLILVLTPMQKWTRVPVHKPKELLWSARKELLHALYMDIKHGTQLVFSAIRSPRPTARKLQTTPTSTFPRKTRHLLRFLLDIVALLTLFIAMILTPATIIVFVIWIEWYINRDIVSQETPQQIGQWGSVVSIALVLISALVLRMRYKIASQREIQNEIVETQEHLRRLEEMLEVKKVKEDRQDRSEMAEVDV